MAALPAGVLAAPTSLPITVDTHIDSRISNGAENWNFGSEHTDKAVVNSIDNPTSLCRALFKLPDDLWLYPPAQIASAKVVFYVWQDNSGSRNVTLFPLSSSFVQGSGSKYGQPSPVDGATWWTRDGSNAWVTAEGGGDFDTKHPVVGIKEDILDPGQHDRFFTWDLAPLLTNPTARAELQQHGALLRIDELPYPSAGVQYWAAFTSSHDPAYDAAYQPHLDLSIKPSLARPSFGVPEFAEPGGVIRAEVKADAGLGGASWAAVLANDLRAWTGAVEQVDYGRFADNDTAPGYRLLIRVPTNLPPETLALSIQHPEGVAVTNRNAVGIVQNLETNFYVVHYTDPQVGGYEPTNPDTGKNGSHGSIRQIYWQVPALALINPRFILNTGDDLDDPYYAFAATNYEQFVDALSQAKVPVLATRGNNDDMISTPDWRRVIGVETYFVDVGSFRVFQKDYNEHNFTEWFTNAYADSFAGTSILYRLFGQHFSDAEASWLPPSGQEPDLMLVGHIEINSTVQANPYPIISTEAAYNKGGIGLFEFARTSTNWTCPTLRDIPSAQFRLMSSGAVARVSCSYAVTNNGTASANVATVTNQIARNFWDGRVRFLMAYRAGGYVVSNGAKLAEYSYNNGSKLAVVVRVNIAPTGTTVVGIQPSVSDLAPHGTPYAWLAQHGLATNETGELYDEGDGVPAWQEYVADTDPTNAASVFRITGPFLLPPWTVHFDSRSNRLYRVLECSDLASGTWSNVGGQPPRVGAGGPDQLQATNAGPRCFYRVNVLLP